MMTEKKRSFWAHPWGYREGLTFAVGLFFVGTLLQISLGNIESVSFAAPINLIFAALFFIGIFFLHFFFSRKNYIKWLASVPATVSSLCVLLLSILIMGFFPQINVGTDSQYLIHKWTFLWGWNTMTSSWGFLLLCFYVLTILGMVILKKTTIKWQWRHVGFYLNHLGIFIALFSGVFGSADLVRLEMTVKEGQVEWRAINDQNDIIELPIALQLDTFIIEEYPPKIVVIDNYTGQVLPKDKPEAYMVEKKGDKKILANLSIEILEYLPNAAAIVDSVFINYAPFYMEGAVPAVKVKATNLFIDNQMIGWVSYGSYLFPTKVLYIDKETSIAMAEPEVKKYTSRVTVFTKEGKTKKADITVNNPLYINDWHIYQSSYDSAKGKYSETSVFELVKDPWLPFIYIGFYMLISGALYLFVMGPKKKRL